MTKIKLLLGVSLLSKLLIVSALYYTVFKTNVVAGAVMAVAHVLYEALEVMITNESYKLQAEAASDFAEQLNKKLGGGTC